MARLVSTTLTVGTARPRGAEVLFRALHRAGSPVVIQGFPLIFWESGSPWLEANDYLYSRGCRVASNELSTRTLQAEGVALHAFAKWLERENCDWRDCPVRREHRVLVRYKAAMLSLATPAPANAAPLLMRSTASARMRVVLHFYRWARSQGLTGPIDLEEFQTTVRTFDKYGFNYCRTVLSSHLSIRCAKTQPEESRLEGGAHPVSVLVRDQILEVAREHSPVELWLMLRLGFMSGMRLGTIADLKIQTLEKARAIEGTTLALALDVGPNASPTVATKYGRNGRVVVPTDLRDDLLIYSNSRRRMLREVKAAPESKNLIFLTRGGQPFSVTGVNRSPAVNTLMLRLRGAASQNGLQIPDFTFHCTRATFATSFAEVGCSMGKIEEAVAFLKEVMLHRDEATTWRYIQYVKNETARAELADRFTRETFGSFSTRLN